MGPELMDLGINQLIKEAYQTALEKGWYDKGDKPFSEDCALFHSEISEALTDYRDGHELNEIYYEDGGKPCGVPVELADTLIRIFDTCGRHKIDLVQALREKLAYNKKRPYRHGGKKF